MGWGGMGCGLSHEKKKEEEERSSLSDTVHDLGKLDTDGNFSVSPFQSESESRPARITVTADEATGEVGR